MPKKHLLIVVAALSALLMSSCSFLDDKGDSGSVSFTIDKATAQKLLEGSRAAANHARIADADLEGLSMDVYLKGDYSQSKTIEPTTGATVTFENLRQASKVYVQADVYFKEPGNNQKILMYTGSSDTIRVNPGQNKVTVNLKGFYYVWFDANGGEGDFEELRILSGSKATKPAADPVREGTEDIAYVFTGWYTSADGDQTLSEKPFDFSTPIKKETVLYAGWVEKRIYTVTYDANNGTAGAFDTQRVICDETTTAPETNPTKEFTETESYEFAGWFTSPDAETPFDFENTAITEDIILYAHWTVKKVYIVTYNAQNGSSKDFDRQLVMENKSTEAPETNPAKESTETEAYEFAGWFTSADGGTLFDFENTKITENLTLYAHWTTRIAAGWDISIDDDDVKPYYTAITVTEKTEGSNVIFTAPEGLTTYTWKVDGFAADPATGVSYGTTNQFVLDLNEYRPGVYNVTLLATKGSGESKQYFSYTTQVKKE